MSNDKNYLTTTQAAKLLSVSPDTVLKWVKAGKLQARRTLGVLPTACYDRVGSRGQRRRGLMGVLGNPSQVGMRS